MKTKKVTIDFNGKNISHQAGSISLDMYLEKIKFENILKGKFDEEGISKAIQHTKGDLFLQQIRGYMQGYSNTTELSRTVNDPLNTKIAGIKIASQPTFSRFQTSLKEADLLKLKDIQKVIISQYLTRMVKKNGGKKIKELEISDDSTKIITYGKQEGSSYISHYNIVGYHPDLVTEDGMRLVIEGVLRNGNVYSSNGSELLIESAINFLKPYVEKIIFKGDSAYGKPEILDVLDDTGIEVDAYIKAKTYEGWFANNDQKVSFNGVDYLILDLPKDYFEERNELGETVLVPRYFTIKHQCKSRSKEENIVCKVERREVDGISLFAVANKNVEMLIVRGALRGKEAFEKYGKRGKQEQIIEELKNEMFVKNLSHTKKIQNSCEFYMKIIAYNLMQILRLETLHGTVHKNCRINTTRRLVFDIGGKIVEHARSVRIQLAESFPFQKRFNLVMERIPKIQFRLC